MENTQIRQLKQDYPNGIPGLPEGSIELIANELHYIYQQGILNSSEYNKLSADTSKTIRVVDGKKAVSTPVNKLYSTVGAYEKLILNPKLSEYKAILAKCNLNDYIMANLTYDKERSETSVDDLLNNIPLASGVVQRGQKIIDRGEIVLLLTKNTYK